MVSEHNLSFNLVDLKDPEESFLNYITPNEISLLGGQGILVSEVMKAIKIALKKHYLKKTLDGKYIYNVSVLEKKINRCNQNVNTPRMKMRCKCSTCGPQSKRVRCGKAVNAKTRFQARQHRRKSKIVSTCKVHESAKSCRFGRKIQPRISRVPRNNRRNNRAEKRHSSAKC